MFEAPPPAPVSLSFKANFFIAIVALTGGWCAIFLLAGHDPALHTVLDTSVALTGALIALLLWDISRRTDESWPLFLTITFGLLTVGELLHVLAVLGWLSGGAGADVQLRAGTWGPPAHLLPIGVAAALLFRDRDRAFAWVFGPVMCLLALGLLAIFLNVPRYTAPGLLSITRPSLILVPLLWTGVGIAYWRRRDNELADVIAMSAAILALSHVIILYSRAPSDPTAMAAHYGKFVGDALLLFGLTRIGAADTARRLLAETQLTALNRALDERIHERTAEVKRAGDLLNAVVENLPDMIFLKEPANDFRYVLINKAGETLLGRNRDQILGRTDAELLPTDQAEQFLRDSRDAAESGQSLAFPDRKLTNPTGVRIVESRKVPIASADGSLLVLGIVRDVTSSRSMEEQLRQLQRMDAIGQLTGGVAHDFNNLLAIIHGNAELVRGRFADDPDAAEMIDDLIGASARGAELVKRLLAFARMQHLEPEAVDLNTRLSSVIGLLQRVIGEEVSLQVKPTKGLWPAIIDPTQVDDALVNLAINARDAMPDGGALTIETGKVHFDADSAASYGDIAPGEYVMLAVTDTGTGMSPETIQRAFEPFYTTKEEGKGTGLGLSQVFGWVKQSGGHIKIYSELGHGTTIKLYLPRAQTDIAAAPKAIEVMTPGGDEMILVVEDNPGVRKTVIRQLHDLGYRTMEAECGARALELARLDTPFDMLLTDVIMPGGITGYQLVDELRQDRPQLKVLFTSGYTELATTPDRPARKDALLSKPYRKQDLGRMVRATLDGAQRD